MSLLAPPYEADGGRALFIVPHPDDEVLGCGAALLAHARAGSPIDVLQVFDGALGNPSGSVEPELVLRREAELLASLQTLVPEAPPTLLSWGLPEGHAPSSADLEHAALRLERVLRERRPTTVFAPWAGDAHPDHHSVSAAVAMALEALGPEAPRAVAYEVWSDLDPDWVVVPEGDDWATLERALACHGSQGGESELRAFLRERGRRRALSGRAFGQALACFATRRSHGRAA